MSEAKCWNNCLKLATKLKNCSEHDREQVESEFWYFADYLVEHYPYSYTEIEVMLEMA